MSKKDKQIRIYLEDYDTLNRYLSLLQYARKQRLSFADVVHELLNAIDKGQLEKLRLEIARS